MTSALWTGLRDLIATPTVPGLGPEQRAGVRSSSDLNRDLERFFAEHRVRADLHAVLRCAALLWHDHLDESHAISQDIHDANGSFLHGIMHRREPDYGNAKYWFHRVGTHAAYKPIAERVAELLKQSSGLAEWSRRLLATERWNASAFVDLCEEHARKPGTTEYKILQQVQTIEFDALLENL
jgi:hypothetical protein